MRQTWERWGGASGLLFFAFAAVLFVLSSDQPDLGASPNEIFRYQIEKNSSIHAYLILWCVALVPLVWFLATLLGTLRNAEREDESPLSTIGAVALAVGLVGVFSTIILEGAAAFRPTAYGPNLTRLLWDMSYVFIPVFSVGFIVFLAAIALMTLRTRLLPAWFGWLTLVPAVLNMVSVGQLAKNDGVFLGDPGFLSVVVWIPFASVVLLTALRRVSARSFGRSAEPVPQGG